MLFVEDIAQLPKYPGNYAIQRTGTHTGHRLELPIYRSSRTRSNRVQMKALEFFVLYFFHLITARNAGRAF